MKNTLKINKIQGLLLVVAGIVLLSAMCFVVVFANFAITDKVANAEEATASANAVPFVVGTSYWSVFFDTSVDVSAVSNALSSASVSDEPSILLNLEGAVAVVAVADYDGYDYIIAYSSHDFDDYIWNSNDGWLIDVGIYNFSRALECSTAIPIDFISSEPFEYAPEPPEPPHTYDDNLAGISVGDSVVTIIPDLRFVGNEFYQDDSRTEFRIAEFSVGGVYYACISVIDAGVAYKYSFCIYTNALLIGPVYRVDLYWAGVEDFGYYIDKYLNLDLTYVGLADEFYEMSADAQEECYRFLNSLSFTSDVPSVELYQDLLNQYNSLELLYDNLLVSNALSPLTSIDVDNGHYQFIEDGFNGYYSVDIDYYRLSDGQALFNIYTDETDRKCGFYLVLPNWVSAGTYFKFSYDYCGVYNVVNPGVFPSPSTNVINIGYVDSNGLIVNLHTISPGDSFDSSFGFNVPVDLDRLFIYSPGQVLHFKNFVVYSNNLDLNRRLDDAYQRGVDSVNINSIAKRAEEAGYYRGLSEQNPYTFRSLMGSVVDAPLDVFTQMFDFDILGVNMKGLYLSLFTLALVILVIKFALARG